MGNKLLEIFKEEISEQERKQARQYKCLFIKSWLVLEWA